MHLLPWLLDRRGRRWLRAGFCPACYSSPPRRACPVCLGSHRYASALADADRAAWAARWALLIGALY